MEPDSPPDPRNTRSVPSLDPTELDQHQATDLPNREVMTLIDTGLLGGSITGGPTPDSGSTGGTSGASDPLGLTGSETQDSTGSSSTPSATSTPLGQSLTGATQTASDGTSLTQGPVSDAAASGATQPYQPTATSVSET